jgi:hypothetical protein
MRNRLHALCPYFAMFPESFAERWIRRLTSPGDVVLDPFSGRGTTAFTALLLDRQAVACDTNAVAYCITRAKACAPTLGQLKRRIARLETKFRPSDWKKAGVTMPEFFHWCYAHPTLLQLLYLRSSLRWKLSDTDSMIAALALGALHGDDVESKNYLSNQMPRTISTKPGYSVRFWRSRNLRPQKRNVFRVLRERAEFRYNSEIPERKGLVIFGDMRALPSYKHSIPGKIRCVVTSPPYFNVTNFEEDQWLRLWFLGGPSLPLQSSASKDDRHTNKTAYANFIRDMWTSLRQILADNAHVVIRIGARNLKREEVSDWLIAGACQANFHATLVSSRLSKLRNAQTRSFRPGSEGCRFELDYHFQLDA